MFVLLYRLWTKIRKPDISRWEALRKGPWDAAIAGSSALRPALLSIFKDELATLSEEELVVILWDMEKFYDNIDITKLVKKVNELGC